MPSARLKKEEFIINVLVILFSVIMMWIAFDYNEKARLLPILVAAILLIASIYQAVKNLRLIQSARKEKAEYIDLKNIIIVTAFLIGFVILLYFIKYYLAAALFVLTFLWLLAKERFLPSLITALCTGVGLFVLFDLILQMNV